VQYTSLWGRGMLTEKMYSTVLAQCRRPAGPGEYSTPLGDLEYLLDRDVKQP
jgi:hypothetical protein